MQYHLARIAAAEVSGKMVDVMSLLRLDVRNNGLISTFERLQYETAEAVASGADFDAAWRQAGAQFREEFCTVTCAGLTAAECQVAYDSEVRRITEDAVRRGENLARVESFLAGLGVVIDFAPIIGDAKGGAECVGNVGWGTCLAAVAGLVPLLGEGGFVDEVTYQPINSSGVRDGRQTSVGREGIAGDVGGHIQACRHGGTCDRFNLFPQNSNFNNSA